MRINQLPKTSCCSICWPKILNTLTTPTTASLSLARAVSFGNLTIGGIVSRGASSITVGSGETELTEVNSGAGANNARSQVQFSTDIAHDWAGLGTVSDAEVLIEVRRKIRKMN